MSDEVEFIWEKTRSVMFHETDKRMRNTYWSPIRAKVPRGWLLTWYDQTQRNMNAKSLTFVPDPNHEWQ
ncbi:MAG: hypothetical protein QF682_07980 [Candidatus Thermoplasmatota archaeon]|jgi:hypothetical protein|nr:hypothetical protein [Candidatus Thermoplasmatota archaeon]